MNERARALAILKQCRDLLAERLTERVLDAREELLGDALGLSFASEIETLYEQLGARLGHVSAMLSNLPPQDDAASGTGTDSALRAIEIRPRSEAGTFLSETAVAAASLAELGALEATAVPSPVTFELFARQIVAGDLDSAGRSLAVLFALDQERARRCAVRFQEQLARGPEVLSRALQLHHLVAAGSVNDPLMLLWECFGLQGPESIGVLQTLQARWLGQAPSA